MSDDQEAPGWDAIEAAFASLYPGQEPHHWGTEMQERVIFGGPQAIDGISAYRAEAPVGHWHWVTFGLTELYRKESDDLEWSGWGYELTMRVPREGDEPPAWALQTLQSLANFAHAKQWVIQAGQSFDTGRPIAEGCVPTGFGFLSDPELPPIDSPHGRVELVQVVALQPSELERWEAEGAAAVTAGDPASAIALNAIGRR